MRKADNREVVADCVRISRKKGESLHIAGASMFNRIRVRLRNDRKRKNQDFQSTKARFQIAIEALGHAIVAIRQYVCDADVSTPNEEDLFWGALHKCVKYIFVKHRREVDAILKQLRRFSVN